MPDGRLALTPAKAARSGGTGQQQIGPDDPVTVPQACVLRRQRHKVAIGSPARLLPRRAEQHQRQKAPRLRLARHEIDRQLARFDGRLRQAGQQTVRARHRIPTGAKGGMHRVQHSSQTIRHLLGLGQLTPQTGIADPGLGPDQTLAKARIRFGLRLRTPAAIGDATLSVRLPANRVTPNRFQITPKAAMAQDQRGGCGDVRVWVGLVMAIPCISLSETGDGHLRRLHQ